MSYKPPEIPEEARAIAVKFFERAQTVAETRNFDYAFELYREGLSKDPEAVEKGHKPLREISIRRALIGGKKPGLLEAMKLKTGQKDPTTAMLAAEFFLARDPRNSNYAEGLVKSADRAELPETLRWGLQVFFELVQQDKKLNVRRLIAIRELYEKLGNYYDQKGQIDMGVDCFQKGLNAIEVAIQAGLGKNFDLVSDQRNLAGKLTILRGKYNGAGDFRDSIRDAGALKSRQDQSRTFKGEVLLEQMIAKARAEVQANPGAVGKITGLVDLLLQRGQPSDEEEAIEILQRSHQQTGQYNFQMRSEDVRVRQMQRKLAELKSQLETQTGGPAVARQIEQAQEELANFELDVYQKRLEQYPTDLKVKFEYGRRLYGAKRYDEAIPIFQEAANDPRHGVRARYYIGTCFYKKGWHTQAINILNKAIESYDIQGDPLSKEMHYVLGRAQEESGETDSALETYGKLIQWDFNYRDVRTRMDRLQGQQSPQA